MKREDVYHSDSEIVSGTPVFTGTRVPVQNLLDYLEGGDTLDDFLEGFPGVSREQAVALLEIAKDRRIAWSSMKEMPGIVKGVDTTIIRDPDREL